MWKELFEQHLPLWWYISISRGAAWQMAKAFVVFRVLLDLHLIPLCLRHFQGKVLLFPNCLVTEAHLHWRMLNAWRRIHSPEERRWKDYQAKQAGGSQISMNVRPSRPFSVPNISNGDAAPSNKQVFTPNPADHSTPMCTFWNNGTSSAASSAGFSSWSFGSIQSTPITTGSPAKAPIPSLCPLSQATPISGLHNQSQLVLQSPFESLSAAPGLSPGVTSISSMSCPMPAASCVQSQSEKSYSLQWPQSSLQASVLGVPSPSATITPSPAAASEDQNILLQRDPTTAGGRISYKIAAEMSFKSSNTESGSLVRHGISSLPDARCKYTHPRTASLLTLKPVFQKTVIRMQMRRHGSLTSKTDRPRVSFLNDYSDVEDYTERNMLCLWCAKIQRSFCLVPLG